MKFHHIAVEGPIGVGKTSLVRSLAGKFDAHLVLENVENPFLQAFYEEKPGAAFQAQLFFLLNRYQQQADLAQRNLFQQLTISDYMFAKDKIFAYLNLNDGELLVYERLYALLETQVRRQDLVIYLHAVTDVLLTLFVTLAILAGVMALEQPAARTARWATGGWLAMALAVPPPTR